MQRSTQDAAIRWLLEPADVPAPYMARWRLRPLRREHPADAQALPRDLLTPSTTPFGLSEIGPLDPARDSSEHDTIPGGVTRLAATTIPA